MADFFSKAASSFPLIKRIAAPTLLGVGALAVGGFTAKNSYEHNTEQEGDKIASSIGVGVSTAGIGLAGAGIATAAAYGPIKKASSNASSLLNKSITLPKVFNNKTPLTKDILKTAAAKPLVLAGVGAIIGGVIGNKLDGDDPNTGVAIGALGGSIAGGAASYAIKGVNLWKNIGPLGRGGAIIGGAGIIAVGGRALMHKPEYQQEDVSESDGMGGGNIQPSGVKSRLATMNARGDLVFGLNNKR